jgi:hypothetical protein
MKTLSCAIVAACVSGLLAGCASSKTPGFDAATRPGEVQKLWSRKLSGLLTDLSVSRDGSRLLVSTIPDPDRDGGQRGNAVALWNNAGKKVWELPVESQTRAQALSGDGRLAVISNYREEVIGIGAEGQVLWKADGTCRPFVLDEPKRVLCYHDDDADPKVAFDVFDWKGKKLLSYPIANDVLALKLAEDARFFAVALTHGQVILFGAADFRSDWQRHVPGEILDVAVSSGPAPQVAVLYHTAKQGQLVALFDRDGKLRGQGRPEAHVEQVEIAPSGNGVLVYGNGPKGQHLALLARDAKGKLAEAWHRADPRYADYSSSLIATQELTIIGFESVKPTERQSHLVAFDYDGKMKWNIPLVTEEGAYLYAQSYSPESSFLGVGTDDSVLSAYAVGK